MLFTYKETTMNKYFLKYKFAYLLATLFIANIPQNTIAHAHVIINRFGRLTQEIFDNLNKFLSKNDRKTYRDHMQIMNKIMSKYSLTLRSVSQPGSELEKDATDLAQDFRKPFIETQSVLQKYQGKNRGFAGNLVKELKEVLPLKQLLPELRTRLTHLHKKAIQQNDIELAKTIQRFIAYIDQQIATWSNKRPLELFSALCRRMELR